MTGYCRNLKYEDTLQCSLYLTHDLKEQGELETLHKYVNEFINNLSREYIWHRDDFKLFLPILKEDTKDSPCLIGTTCFGDNVEDEWFIIYLILEITKKYFNVIAQVEDNDGDFLLIEAANHLPSWANPDSTENRVFIYKGKIHIINPSLIPINSKITIQEAILTISKNCQKTVACAEIQQAILQRIGNYPQKIETLCHKANVLVPVEIAVVLHLMPSLISSIITSYCNMDLIDMNHCKDLTFNNNVTVKIKFTKYLYAMLLNSKSVKLPGVNNIDDKKTQLGMKLACGYQIIKNSPMKDEFSSLEYKKFLNSLNKNGYFKNNLEGSKDYKELLAKANNYFLSTESSITSHVNNIISHVQSTAQYNDLLTTFKDLNPLEDDNDDWLNVNPEHLNDILNSKYSNENSKSNKGLKNKLSNFLQEKSDFEGIEKRDEDMFNDSNIEFDSEEFVKSLDKMLRFVSNDCDLNDSDSDDDLEVLSDDMNDMDTELASKLHDVTNFNSRCDPKEITKNLVQSLKEEELSGPSSNILKSIGINKTDMLDSDDDEK